MFADQRRRCSQIISGNQRRHQRLSALQGQVTLEYFIIFAVLAFLTVVTVTTFDNKIETSLKGFFNAAAKKIAVTPLP